MAATNTYVDVNGDRRWKQGAMCPALGGDRTCGQHLADHQALVGVVTALPKKRRQDFLGRTRMLRGCSGRIYPLDLQDMGEMIIEPQECRTFQCGTCGKNVPWSFGCGDEYLDDCDDCAVKKMKKEGKL